MSSEQTTIHGQPGTDETQACTDEEPTVRDCVVKASKAGATLYNGQPVGVVLEDPDNDAELSTNATKSALVHQGVLRQLAAPKKLLVLVRRSDLITKRRC